jgi:fatty acid desaturase
MRPRFAADYRTLLWVALTMATVAVQYARPELCKYLWWVSAYFALSCGVIAHNHNHCPTFTSKGMNNAFANVISIFYGYPVFAWIPTHNLNHHKFVNRAGDATITWRFTNKRTPWVAATYFFVSSYYQGFPIKAFIKKAREQNPALYRRIVGMYVFWGGTHLALLATAILLHGLKMGLYVYVLSVGLPAFGALWTIMLFNYEQHVHTDPWSKYDHSRSWERATINFFLFNNGYHATHHENPGTHWSKLKALHFELAPKRDPRLIVKHNIWWYFAKQYLFAPFFPSLGSVQIGRAPFEPPQGELEVVNSADVDLGEAGTNAAMVS